VPKTRSLAAVATLCALVAALSVALSASPASAATPDLNWRHFVGIASGRCLDVDTNTNYKVQLWSCDSGSDESWGLQYAGTLYGGVSYYEVVNRRTGNCLTGTGVSGAAVFMGNCSTVLTPWWYFPVTTGSVTPFVNVGSGLCLDARNNGKGNGTVVQEYGCNGTSAQSWNDVDV
jgi:hypothetical protein